jgi:CHAT domain-containing protein
MGMRASLFCLSVLLTFVLQKNVHSAEVQLTPTQVEILKLTSALETSLVNRDLRRSDELAEKITRSLHVVDTLNTDLSKTFYLLGVSAYYKNSFKAANENFAASLRVLKRFPCESTENRVMRFKGYMLLEMEEYALAIAEMEKFIKLLESRTSVDIQFVLDANYIILQCSAKLGLITRMKSALNDYLKYQKKFPELIDSETLFQIESERAMAYFNNYDFRKSQVSLESAINIYKENSLNNESSFSGALGLLGASSFYTGEFEKSLSAYESAYNYSKPFRDLFTGVTSDYALVLGETGHKEKGKDILEKSLILLEKEGGKDRFYFHLLINYAIYLEDYNIDFYKSFQINKECLEYCNRSNLSEKYKWPILLSISRSLARIGNNRAANDSIEALFKRRLPWYVPGNKLSPADASRIEPQRDNYKLFDISSDVFNILFNNTKDTSFLRKSAFLSAEAASVMERIKLNTGNEEGQLISGSRYRKSYIRSIEGFSNYYSLSGDPRYLDLAFSFSERSKASSLLSSTRQSKAARLNIPESLLEKEKSLAIQLGNITSKIDEEKTRNEPDNNNLASLNSKLAVVNLKKDSLLNYLENAYPEYVKARGDLSVISPEELAAVTGKHQDFLSYVVTDSIIYSFLINRNGLKIFFVKSGKDFQSAVSEFRRLTSEPDRGTDAASDEYLRFQKLGHQLYNILIAPAKPHLTSNRLIVSPDNILSFFPFELLLTDSTAFTDCYYSRLPFLMKETGVSYTYSGTLLKERKGRRPGIRNSAIAIAPLYTGKFDIDSTLSSRQAMEGNLPVLKYSPEEAAFVAGLTRGKMLYGKDATEARFKAESPYADLIHLAMHTLLDTRYPANSRMLFTQERDSIEDNNLQPFEINSLNLNSRMVVLSSCYTGSGIFFSGEGVLSIARSFILAGSSSVVMSLWEVHDRSGTDIMKLFYKYLKRGYSKSSALRKARLEFLDNSGQLESHPYFWSTLVVYGDDSPVYLPVIPLIAGIVLLAGFIVGIYFYRRP